MTKFHRIGIAFLLSFVYFFSSSSFAQSANLAPFLDNQLCFREVNVYNNGEEDLESEVFLLPILERLNLLYGTKFERGSNTCALWASYNVNYYESSSGYIAYVTEIVVLIPTSRIFNIANPDGVRDPMTSSPVRLDWLRAWRTWSYGITENLTYKFLQDDLTKKFENFLIEWRRSH